MGYDENWKEKYRFDISTKILNVEEQDKINLKENLKKVSNEDDFSFEYDSVDSEGISKFDNDFERQQLPIGGGAPFWYGLDVDILIHIVKFTLPIILPVIVKEIFKIIKTTKEDKENITITINIHNDYSRTYNLKYNKNTTENEITKNIQSLINQEKEDSEK